MDMSGEYRIRASKQSVWDALNDPETLRASIPGCQTVEKVSENQMTATVVAKVGPVKATFKGKVTLSDLDPPHGYTITGEGQGGPVGFGKGSATVCLAEEGDETVLSYTASAQVGGKLAQIGQRLVDSTAKSMTTQFFTSFAEAVGRPAAESAHEQVTGASEPAPAAITPPPGKGVSTRTWVVGIVGIVVILLLIFAAGE
jgi:hypothetical protein